MSDLREGVSLVHELRQLRRPKKLSDRSHNRFSVDQVMRHRRRHFLVDRHFFLNCPFHPHQANPKLIFKQFTNRPDTTITKMIDVINVHGISS